MGLVVEQSKRCGYPAPANVRVVEIVRHIERGVPKSKVADVALAMKS